MKNIEFSSLLAPQPSHRMEINMNIIRKSDAKIPMLNHNKDVAYLTFPALSKYSDFIHAFSTRIGGVSKGIYESMNLSFTRGDDEDCVRENFVRFTSALDIPYESVVMSDQTHTTNVRVVTKSDRGNGLTRPKSFFDTDGLITNEPDVALFTSFADCVPLFFIDSVHKAIGMTHSGWRGTVGRIGAVTVEKMHSEYGSEPSDIVAAIGPSICADCYEVSIDVAEAFQKEFGNLSDSIVYTQDEYYRRHNINKPSHPDKFQLDLWRANQIILEEAGILPENISTTNICTCCNPTVLFSHRASCGQRGNLAGILMIKNNI